jgi:hypothetical protein
MRNYVKTSMSNYATKEAENVVKSRFPKRNRDAQRGHILRGPLFGQKKTRSSSKMCHEPPKTNLTIFNQNLRIEKSKMCADILFFIYLIKIIFKKF